MGWNIRIGEFKVVPEPEYRYCFATVECVDSAEGSPINSAPDRSNGIAPSYTAWSALCDRHRITKLGEGCHEITEADYEEFRRAKDAHPVKHSSSDSVDVSSQDADYWDAIRLEYLVWWTRWALDNCKYPTISMA